MTDANKDPSYPWYPRDFAADGPVQTMTLAEEGAYRRLLDYQWLNGSVPADIRLLARICKNTSPQRMQKMWLVIGQLFSESVDKSDQLQNGKLERIRREREEFLEQRREAGSAGGKKRWDEERRRQARRETDSTPTIPLIAGTIAEPYPAVCSLPSAETTTTTSAEPIQVDHTDGQIMAAIRERLYAPDGKPPAGWEEGREFSIMRNLRNLGKSGSQIHAVVEGLGCLLREERVDWLKGKATLRAVYNSKTGVLDMWGQAEDAYYRQGATFVNREPQRPGDIRNAIHRELAKSRRGA